MKRQFLLTTVLFLTAVTCAVAQMPNRDLNQIRSETSERNRAINDYDRRNPNGINPAVPGGKLIRNGKIPGSEVRKYVLAAQVETEVKVVAVGSGDTLLIDDGVKRVIISILGIDAPENGQTFYEEAKRNLSDLITGKNVVLKYSLHNLKNDFGYFPARVFVGEKDIGLSILQNGFAWRSEKDKFFLEKKDDETNERAEAKARSAKTGIWKDAKPQKPWEYRARKIKEIEKSNKKDAKN